ncbi:predicted protein [Lichtheimia corymbifera JMRC:FSU:9682]|uniref:Uncharacterized protein n=1 Tax=Lichtheimia corymbifera JMRC:FSU:9682 TaxID=1263082 RepID=A0A068RRG8_9FUNG|nr:predicted protein [Lichtheimia corymbifera JMRC:FSU:9682]
MSRRHKKSRSCTVLPLPLALTSSIATHASDPMDTRSPHPEPYPKATSSCSSSTSNSSHNSSISSSQDAQSGGHLTSSYDANSREENTTVRSGLSSLLRHRTAPFPLPSFCIFSRKALSHESAPQGEIVPYFYPESVPVDSICMLVGVLESLLRTMDDITNEQAGEEDDDADEDDEDYEQLCKIIGLGTFKVAIWKGWEEDRGLAVILSTQFPDHVVTDRMQAIQDILKDGAEETNEVLGSKIIKMIQRLFK